MNEWVHGGSRRLQTYTCAIMSAPEPSLLVAASSRKHVGTQPAHGAATQPSTAARNDFVVSGSNSYGDCRNCPRSFPLKDGRVPAHLPPVELRAWPGDSQTCPGSLSLPAQRLGA